MRAVCQCSVAERYKGKKYWLPAAFRTLCITVSRWMEKTGLLAFFRLNGPRDTIGNPLRMALLRSSFAIRAEDQQESQMEMFCTFPPHGCFQRAALRADGVILFWIRVWIPLQIFFTDLRENSRLTSAILDWSAAGACCKKCYV